MDYTQASSRSGLTGSDVLDIRRLHSEGYTDSEIANTFGIHRKTVYNIVNRKTWQAVPNPISVRGFSGYEVYPDGRVFSKAANTFVSQIQRVSGPAVRIRTSNGRRTTVPLNTLLKGFGNRR